jgi:hypothetical protein
MKISIIGLGWLGFPLALELKKNGHEVSGTTRSLDKKKAIEQAGIKSFLLNYPELPPQELLDTGLIILNIPPFQEALQWWTQWKWNKTTKIIFISSTGDSPLLREQEEWIQRNFNNSCIIRFGGLIGSDRHPGKQLSGRKDLKGRLWPVNLIHLEDCIGLIQTVIDKNITNQILEAVSPSHPTREEYYSNYCLNKKIPLPQFDQNDVSKKQPAHSNCDFYRFKKNITEY